MPFVIYYGMIYLAQMVEWRIFDPGELLYLMPIFQTNPLPGICVLTIIPAAEIAIVYFAFKRGVVRRYSDGRI